MIMMRILAPRCDEEALLDSLLRRGFSGVTRLPAQEDRETLVSLLIAVTNEDKDALRETVLSVSEKCKIEEKPIEQSYSIRTGKEFLPERMNAE